MGNIITSIQQLIAVAKAIIETPSLSVKDFGIEMDKSTNMLMWTGNVTAHAYNSYPALSACVAHSICNGTGVIISSNLLKVFGFAALAGLGAAAAGAGIIPIVGWVAASLIATYGATQYYKKKKEQQEKDRLVREIIKQQQAAMKKQRLIIAELENLLRNETSKNQTNEQRMKDLKSQINNLKEIIGILTSQNNNFKTA